MSISLDDPDLAERIRRRDPAAIEAVVDACLAPILRAATGAGLDRQTAEDTTQAAFATFLESAHRFEGRSHVRTWAGRCAEPGPEEAETLERLRTSLLDRARDGERPEREDGASEN